MKQIILAAIATSLFATSVTAMPTNVDANRDGFASLSELRAIYTDLTEASFIDIDMDGDGLVNDEEMLVAIDAGLIAKGDDYA